MKTGRTIDTNACRFAALLATVIAFACIALSGCAAAPSSSVDQASSSMGQSSEEGPTPVYAEASYVDEFVEAQMQRRQAAASTSDEELAARAQELLSEMDASQKVGQLILARCPMYNQLEAIQKYDLGGIFLYETDFRTGSGKWYPIENLKQKLGSFIASSRIAPLLAVDEEGGTVQRLGGNEDVFPEGPLRSPLEIVEEDGEEALFEDALEKNATLLKYGINVNLSPVVDVPVSEDSFMYERSLGIDAEVAAQRATAIVSAMDEVGIGSVLKHFPGYGDNGDTHSTVATDARTLDDFRSRDFLPFAAGIDAGADAVMLGHFYAKGIDPDLPASLSEETVRILREELGFAGVIIADDVWMVDAGSYGIDGNIAVAAIRAGNDMVISTSYDDDHDALLQALTRGFLEESRVDEAVARVLCWKLRLGIIS